MSLLTNKQSKKIWDSVLGKLELRIPRPSFNTWLKETKGVSFDSDDSDLFFVSVPDAFTASYLEERMLGILENEISDILKKEVKLNFIVDGQKHNPKENTPIEESVPLNPTPVVSVKKDSG